LAKAAQAKLLRTDRVRADTTVVEADVAYPTDTGLLAKAVGKIARTVQRIKAAGGAPRTKSRDRRRAAGRRARSIASKLRLRGALQRDEAQATVRRITGELADLAEAATRQADAVLRNARRALRGATGQSKGRLRRAVQELGTVIARTRQVVQQARTRVGGQVPDGATRLVSLHDPDARPIRKGRLGKPVEFGYKAQILDNADGVILDHTSRSVTLSTHPSSPQPSNGSPAAPAAHHARSPPTAAMAKPASRVSCTNSASAASPSPVRPNPAPAAASSSTDVRSARWSSGAPDPKAGSTTSNAATAGTAPNSPASTVHEPGADTGYSPTTWSRSGHGPHE